MYSYITSVKCILINHCTGNRYECAYMHPCVYIHRLAVNQEGLRKGMHTYAIDEWRISLTDEELQRVFAMAPLLRKLGYPL